MCLCQQSGEGLGKQQETTNNNTDDKTMKCDINSIVFLVRECGGLTAVHSLTPFVISLPMVILLLILSVFELAFGFVGVVARPVLSPDVSTLCLPAFGFVGVVALPVLSLVVSTLCLQVLDLFSVHVPLILGVVCFGACHAVTSFKGNESGDNFSWWAAYTPHLHRNLTPPPTKVV